MVPRVRNGLFNSADYRLLPSAAQHLAFCALRRMQWHVTNPRRSVNYDLINVMIEECIALAGPKVDDTWLLVLYAKVIEREAELSEKWFHPVVQYNGRSMTRSIYGRLFAGAALWRVELAVQAIKANDLHRALNEIAYAGEALFFAGIGEGHSEMKLDHSDVRRKAAAVKLARDPKAVAMTSIRDEWERWQRREVSYRSDADFGRKMHIRHPELVSDRSIAQRAAAWRKEWKWGHTSS